MVFPGPREHSIQRRRHMDYKSMPQKMAETAIELIHLVDGRELLLLAALAFLAVQFYGSCRKTRAQPSEQIHQAF